MGAAATVTAHTPTLAPALATVAFAVAAVAVRLAPDDVVAPPGPAVEVSNTQSDGMTDRDVLERLAIVRERNEYKDELTQEKIDEQRKSNNTPTVGRMGGKS